MAHNGHIVTAIVEGMNLCRMGDHLGASVVMVDVCHIACHIVGKMKRYSVLKYMAYGDLESCRLQENNKGLLHC